MHLRSLCTMRSKFLCNFLPVSAFTLEDLEKETLEFFWHEVLHSATRGFEIWGDTGDRNGFWQLISTFTAPQYKNKHCYKHHGSNVGLVSSVSNRQLHFATQTMTLHFLLQVTTKITLTNHGEVVMFTKLSFKIYSTTALLSFPVIRYTTKCFSNNYYCPYNWCQWNLVIVNFSQRTFSKDTMFVRTAYISLQLHK